MIVALPVHIVAIIVWLGGLFLLTVVLGPTIRELAPTASISLWHRVLSRFFVWGSVGLVAIVASGIAIVQLRFGGFSGMPVIHRWNMVVGVPAIALYAYAQIVPWRACCRAIADDDWIVAGKNAAQIRTLLGIVLALGLIASVVSAAGRFGHQL
jgi:uncharacterized membrane protein